MFVECKAEKVHMFVYLSGLGGQFYGLFGTLLPALLRVRRPHEHGKIMKIHWFL